MARSGGCDRGSEDRDAFTAAQPQGCLRNRIIDQHQLLRDELLHPGAAGFRKMRHQKLVQPFAGVCCGRGNQKWRHVWRGRPARARPRKGTMVFDFKSTAGRAPVPPWRTISTTRSIRQ